MKANKISLLAITVIFIATTSMARNKGTEVEKPNSEDKIEITKEEIEMALQDRMVTKVIYLEQPDFAMPVRQEDQPLVEDLPQHINLLQAADYRGRPMAILRLGGRIPDPNSPHEFYSDSPILISRQATDRSESSDVVVIRP